VNKKAGKRTKAAKELPFVSRDWWPLDKTRGYCHKHMGDWRIADDVLLTAANAGELPVKYEWVDQQISPPVQRRRLSVEDYELRAYDFHKVWLVQPRRPDVPAISQRHALFFWGPKVKELCPMEEAEPAGRPALALLPQEAAEKAEPRIPDASTRARRGPKPFDWELYKAKFYLMLDDDDVPAHSDINASYYADRLMTWGRNNFGEKETPEQAAMREKVAEWKPLWQRLKGASK